jgi:sugar lactone lactonase YvrE
VLATFDDFVGGLGFLPDGDLLCVLSKGRTLQRIGAGGVSLYADLSGLCRFVLNDMVVREGRAYVSQPGFDIWSTPMSGFPEPTDIIVVEAGGEPRIAASGLLSPNGMAVDPDGRTLYVAECTGLRIGAFDVHLDGGLSGHRTFAQLPDGAIPDGICLDAEGAIWAAAPVVAEPVMGQGPGVLRLTPDGQATHLVPVGEGRRALACALGGPDRRTLFICTVADFAQGFAPGSGRIEQVRVDVAGAGIP